MSGTALPYGTTRRWYCGSVWRCQPLYCARAWSRCPELGYGRRCDATARLLTIHGRGLPMSGTELAYAATAC
eukprot:1755716-Rhodomonas_salina.2